jgi:hypothetical protein
MPQDYYTPPGYGGTLAGAANTERASKIATDAKRGKARALAEAGVAAMPTIALTLSAASKAEDAADGAFVFTATLSAAVPFDVVVTPTWTGTATNVSDYTRPADATKTIAAGQTTTTFDCAIVDEATVESSETVILTIAAAALGYALEVTPEGSLSRTFTITNDDE